MKNILSLLIIISCLSSSAQEFSMELLKNKTPRNIGPGGMSGRVTSIDVVHSNPDIMYAGTWELIRTPYSLESGGAGSGMYKSIDGGNTWTSIKNNKGLPKGVWGIVGVAVAKSNTDKLYALIENANGITKILK